jgi:thioredoxin reductase
MTKNVNVIVVGANGDAFAAAADAARRGLRVVVVIRSRAARFAQQRRRRFRALELRVIVLTGAEVVCVDGVNSIEAVVVRYVRSGRLVGFNATELLSFGDGV